MNIKETAQALDGLIVALDLLAQRYADQAAALDIAYRDAHRGHEHPVYSSRATHIRSAVGSRVYLARLLGLAPVNPPVSVTSAQPRE